MNHIVRTYHFVLNTAGVLLATTMVLSTASAASADVELYFSDRATVIEQDCTATLLTRRSYGVKRVEAEFLLLELLSGPSKKERLAGAADSFAPLSGGEDSDSRLVKYLIRAERKKGQFNIYFRQPALAWFNNGSCGAATVLSPIQATLLPLSGIDAVQIFIEGDRLQDVMDEVGGGY